MATLAKSAMLFVCVILALIGVCFGAAFYKVGDSLGWTNETGNNIDYYKDWASNKTFYVGDTFYFEYDNKENDVMQVSHEDFHSCNPKAPVNIYESGRDSITMWEPGHLFYICTKHGHCKAGQKVDIRVLSPPPPTSTPSQPPSSPGSSTAPTIPAAHPSQPPSPGSTASAPAAPDNPSQPSSPSSSSTPAIPDQPSHSSPPAPAPSKNSAPSSLSSEGLLLSLQLLTALGFLAYNF